MIPTTGIIRITMIDEEEGSKGKGKGKGKSDSLNIDDVGMTDDVT